MKFSITSSGSDFCWSLQHALEVPPKHLGYYVQCATTRYILDQYQEEAEKERNESGADRKKERIIAFPLGKEIPKNRGFVCHSFYLLTKIVV